MKFLILSCKTGGGHDAAANALKQQFESDGHEAFVFDYLTLRSKNTAKNVSSLYVRTVQTVPSAFGFAYKIALAWAKKTRHSPVYAFNTAMVKYLKEYLNKNRYDGIICTHLYPAETLTAMKHRGIPLPPFFFVYTDYTTIPFVEETCADEYISPHPALVPEAVRRGIPVKKLHPFGIPVSQKFTEKREQKECKTHLGLNENKKTILLIGGSMGAGNLALLADAFYRLSPENVQVAVICGSNKKVFDELNEKYSRVPLFKIFGKTDEMPLFMTASDVIYTKPGGLTSTEAAASRKPLVLIYPIPGCETFNREFFVDLNMAVTADTPDELVEKGLNLLADEEAKATMINAQTKNVDANATENIVNFIVDRTKEIKTELEKI